MKIEIFKIFEGIKNSIFVKDEVEKIAASRIAICELCPHYSPNVKATGIHISRLDKHCTDCGCNMFLKTRALAAACPLGSADSNFSTEKSRWSAEVTELEAATIENTSELKKQIEEYTIKLMNNKIVE